MPQLLPQRYYDEALCFASYVRKEQGQWVVYVEVTFPDVIRRFKINTYRTRRRAEIAAHWIKRGADKNLRRPSLGFL